MKFAFSAFILWGILPFYIKQITLLNAYELTAYRILFSSLTLLPYIYYKGEFTLKKETFITAALIGVNWLLFVYAVESNHIIEASLGYFLCPLMSIALGFIFLGESANNLKKFAIGLATIAVALKLTLSQSPSWISLSLAITFSLYGLIKKNSSTPALLSLFNESILLTPLAIGYIITQKTVGLSNLPLEQIFWMSISGVLTITPLYFFTRAVRQISLSSLGIIQFIAPGLQFLIGILFYQEVFTLYELLPFCLLLLAVLILVYHLRGEINL